MAECVPAKVAWSPITEGLRYREKFGFNPPDGGGWVSCRWGWVVIMVEFTLQHSRSEEEAGLRGKREGLEAEGLGGGSAASLLGGAVSRGRGLDCSSGETDVNVV